MVVPPKDMIGEPSQGQVAGSGGAEKPAEGVEPEKEIEVVGKETSGPKATI